MRRLQLISLVALGLLALSCNGDKKAATDTASEKMLVKTARSSEATVEQLVEFTGTIQPFLQNVICPAMPGRIDEILVDVGDNVKKGELLVKMDQTQYRQTVVQLAQLEADYQRMKTVYEASGLSKQQVDAQLTQVEVSQAAAKNLLENIELRSPISGVVTGRYYDPGDMFSLSPKDGITGVLTVMDIDKLKIQINVSEQYFPQVKVGMPVDITLDIYPDKKFAGKISLLYPAVDPATRTFTVEITIPNSSHTLRPGMFSRVALNFGTAERVMVPDVAIQKQMGTNEKFVYVIENGVANRRTVTIGRQIGDKIEVLSGVNNDEEVVIAGASKLMDQTEVTIKGDQTNPE